TLSNSSTTTQGITLATFNGVATFNTLTTNYANNLTAATTLGSGITGAGALVLASGSGSASLTTAPGPGTFLLTGTNSTGAAASNYTGLTLITNQALVKLLSGSALGAGSGPAQGTVVSAGSEIQILSPSTGTSYPDVITVSGTGLNPTDGAIR